VLTISNAQTTNSGSYTVIVTNIAGSVTSSNAILTVTNIPPSITGQPTNQTVAVGTTVTGCHRDRDGAVELPMVGERDEPGDGMEAKSVARPPPMLTISHAQTTNSGNYTVIVTNFGGSVTSSVAILTVASSPVIVMQPSNQTVAVGATATFVVTASEPRR
jgi:plastocyanin